MLIRIFSWIFRKFYFFPRFSLVEKKKKCNRNWNENHFITKFIEQLWFWYVAIFVQFFVTKICFDNRFVRISNRKSKIFPTIIRFEHKPVTFKSICKKVKEFEFTKENKKKTTTTITPTEVSTREKSHNFAQTNQRDTFIHTNYSKEIDTYKHDPCWVHTQNRDLHRIFTEPKWTKSVFICSRLFYW